MDSFGNICGTRNEVFGNLTLSGMDMTEKPFVFYFDIANVNRSTSICVGQCPTENLYEMDELQDYFFNTSINYCRYDFNISDWSRSRKSTTFTGSILELDNILCPKFPVYSRYYKFFLTIS
jgi:hypothetical protein